MEMNTGRRPETAESVTGIVVNGERRELSPATSGTLRALPPLAGHGPGMPEDDLAGG